MVVCCAAKSLCFTKEEHWRLLLSGVLEDDMLINEESIPGTLFRAWWRHPLQVDMELSINELKQLLS